MSKRSRGTRRILTRRWDEERKARERVPAAIAVALPPVEPCPEEIRPEGAGQ